MDTEDREHFRTIGSASARQQTGTLSAPSGENSSSDPDPAYCLRAAKLIFACYRRDEAHDPELYSAAIAAVLADFPRDIIDLAADPRTGIASESKFLPAVAEVMDFCRSRLARREKLAHYASLPPPKKRFVPDHLQRTANLFVPQSSPRYDKMMTRAGKDQGRGCWTETRVCADGAQRTGLWVPLDWWEGPLADVARDDDGEIMAPPMLVSDALKELIAKQNAERVE